MGLERLVALLEEGGLETGDELDVYLIAVGAAGDGTALQLAERLREALPDLRLLTHCGGGGFKSQFKKADRSGARLALVLGEDELARQVAAIKPLRDGGEEQQGSGV